MIRLLLEGKFKNINGIQLNGLKKI